MCAKRDELHQQILQEEEEKRKVQNDIRILTERLVQINESLARKIATRNDYDRTVAECETAYKKVSGCGQYPLIQHTCIVIPSHTLASF